mmetsp:Transcript_39676/g.89485  ORF Transcript_39676/g.89485 Transcript_39676/m.89485 type:complete len:109 (+) Transcript_39676:68-394(+)
MASKFNMESDLSGFERPSRSAQKKPPVGWSASKSQSLFQDGRQGSQGWKGIPDNAGPQGGGGTSGPSLPFRIIEGLYKPQPCGHKPVFTITKPRPEDPSKADGVIFTY